MKLSQDLIERNVGWLVVLIVLVVSVGGLVEIVPLYFQRVSSPTPRSSSKAAISTSAKAATTVIRR